MLRIYKSQGAAERKIAMNNARTLLKDEQVQLEEELRETEMIGDGEDRRVRRREECFTTREYTISHRAAECVRVQRLNCKLTIAQVYAPQTLY